jgi:glycosyltransferase involved in cell wall biosynthesis
MLDHITPVILTFNEEPNIGRTLERLRWARDIVVVDSYSTDKTLEIVKAIPQARIFQRKFDTHAQQWNYATAETAIATPWVLALDADYILPDEAVAEISRIDPGGATNGYTAAFRYCIWGKPLRGTLYPPVTVLYRREKGSFIQDGHTQRLKLDGASRMLSSRLLHDDRKPLSHWLAAQDRYMRLEATTIAGKQWSQLGMADRIRQFPLLAPFAVFANCYLLKGGILDGRAGLYYALQRMLAEALLGLRIIERSIALETPPSRE